MQNELMIAFMTCILLLPNRKEEIVFDFVKIVPTHDVIIYLSYKLFSRIISVRVSTFK